MIKASFIEEKVIVNGSTTVVIYAVDIHSKSWDELDSNVFHNFQKNYNTFGRPIFKGISKCSPEDTFDASLGKRIAESRVKIEVYKQLYLAHSKVFDDYCKKLIGKTINWKYRDGFALQAAKYYDLWLSEKRHLKNLLDESICSSN